MISVFSLNLIHHEYYTTIVAYVPFAPLYLLVVKQNIFHLLSDNHDNIYDVSNSHSIIPFYSQKSKYHQSAVSHSFQFPSKINITITIQ